MKKQNIWLWALTAAVVLLAAALAETQGQLGELQTAYSALQQEVGELRLDLKSTQNRLQEQEEALERAAAQTAPQPEESLLERYKLELPPRAQDEETGGLSYGYDLLERAARKRGFLISGGAPDTERMAKVLLDEFRAGRLGRFTLEAPEGAESYGDG